MAEIIVAKSAGFCFGVRRAIKILEELTQRESCVYTLGPIIHNPQEVERLKGLGVKTLNGHRPREGTIVIRTHGIPPREERKIKAFGLKVVDATCPYVKAVHEAVVSLSKEGYFVVIVGERNHPEVIGTLGYLEEVGGRGKVVEDLKDLKEVFKEERVGVVAQTTQREELFKEVVGELSLWVKELKVINTICNATSTRQEEVKEIAPKVDVMLIVGGRNSGNTTRLYQIAKSLNPNSYHVETQGELKREWFSGARRVGITAGASTPDWIIEGVIKRVRELCS